MAKKKNCACPACTWNRHCESLIARREKIAAAYQSEDESQLAVLLQLIEEDRAEHQVMLELQADIEEC